MWQDIHQDDSEESPTGMEIVRRSDMETSAVPSSLDTDVLSCCLRLLTELIRIAMRNVVSLHLRKRDGSSEGSSVEDFSRTAVPGTLNLQEKLFRGSGHTSGTAREEREGLFLFSALHGPVVSPLM
ncbi:hypothetical protein DPMN_141038 [Dreissena polymorpha]|uniref:Uncharacterized protein n=1 Tax=Dreissena polymorpha TaxID=45954 RepID=A0A9D4JM92_DREPO|nr:hypothetical protein DPMN_141038 [Dreissena polymorpha]